MSSSSNTLKHKNGTSLTGVKVAQLENLNPPSLNTLPLMPATSLNLSTSNPPSTKEEKK